jgi:hypothetical protein
MRRIILAALLAVSPALAPGNSGPAAYPDLPEGHYIPLQPSTLLKSGTGPVLTLPDLPGIPVEVGHKRRHGNGDLSLQGVAKSGDGSFHLTFGPGSVFGVVHQSGNHWLVTTDATGSWLVRLPKAGLVYDTCGTAHPAHPHQGKRKSGLESSGPQAATEVTTVIDLMIIYNQAFSNRYPGDLLATRINHVFDIANLSMANSEVGLAFRLVGLEQYNYRNGNSNSALLQDMARALGGESVAGLEGLGARRNLLGADLVVMFRPHKLEDRGSCGQAYFPANDWNPDLGAGTVSDGMSSWSLCTDDVLTHEIGHNLGASHQIGLGGGGFDPRGAAFFKPGQLSTVMASFGTGRPDRFRGLPIFSNPDVDCGGVACGAVDMNNSAVIRSTMAEIADYIEPAEPIDFPDPTERINSDSDGDGVIDWDDHFPFDSKEQDDSDLDGAGDNGDAFVLDAAEQLDSDNDGIGNAADSDDDGDQTSDLNDAFPLDPNEQSDSDQDGVGDVADHFPFSASEHQDNDQDGNGNNADPDDDNDGTPEFAAGAWDLLVVSAGNNRILRFDAATGEPRGIEVSPSDGLLTWQSALAFRQADNTLFYLSDSSIKRLNLMNRRPLGVWVPPYNDKDLQSPQMFSGFPTSVIANFGPWGVAASGMSATSIRQFSGQENARFAGNIDWSIPAGEVHIDMVERLDQVYILGTESATLFKADALGTQFLAGPGMPWMKNPRRMAIVDGGTDEQVDDRLFISDQGRNSVATVSFLTGEFYGDLADLGAEGYSGPDGLVLTPGGELLVAASKNDVILAFDANEGTFLGERVTHRSGGLREPRAMLLVPQLADRFNDDPGRVIRPNPGLWYNPATDGRGFDIQVFGKRLSAVWYTYDRNGLPTWYFSAGDLVDFTYSATLLRFRMNQDGTTDFEEVGTLELVFESERNAVMSFNLEGHEGSGPLQWLAFDSNPAEPEQTGLWGRADGPGWGLALANQGGITVAIVFAYDLDGAPRWAISEAVPAADEMSFEMLTAFSENLCPSCSGPPDAAYLPAGSMTLALRAPETWSSAIIWPAPLQGEWALEGTPIIRYSDTPQRPR